MGNEFNELFAYCRQGMEERAQEISNSQSKAETQKIKRGIVAARAYAYLINKPYYSIDECCKEMGFVEVKDKQQVPVRQTVGHYTTTKIQNKEIELTFYQPERDIMVRIISIEPY